MCKYFYKKENGKKYLFVEWKNGNYIYANIMSGYYVF